MNTQGVTEILKALLVSGCLGALIGLERQWDEQHHGEKRASAGTRTFTFWALLGTLCAWFSDFQNPAFFLVGFAVMAAFVTVYLAVRRAAEDRPGFTTAAVTMLTYLIGGLAYWKHWQIAVILTITTTLLLANKARIHGVSRHFTREDVHLALQFAVVTGIILPLVPDETFGPLDAFNPRSVWMMVVIVSGLGLVGYAAMRILGTSAGLGLTGILGGIASSTATTLAMSRQSRTQAALSRPLAWATILACTIMLWRVGILVLAINRSLFFALLPALLIISLPGLLAGFWPGLRKIPVEKSEPVEMRNPLSLSIALQFAALYAVIGIFTKAAAEFVGNSGLYVVSFVSGIADLDAITLSLTRMVGIDGLDLKIAVHGIILAAMANTLLKACLGFALGSPAYKRIVAVYAGATIAVASAVFIIT